MFDPNDQTAGGKGKFLSSDVVMCENKPIVTFFMIVTDSCAPIAHYCIRSYRKLEKRGIRFRLVVYGNCLSRETEVRYYPQWRQLDYVDLMDNREQVAGHHPVAGEKFVTPEGLERTIVGPFELGGTVWTRELKQFKTPYIATVDADFEILSPGFVIRALEMLDGDKKLAGVSTDYSPDNEHFQNPYLKCEHFLHQRWHAWFCIYRRECLQGDVSHHAFRYRDERTGELRVFDDGALLQDGLLKQGWHFSVLPGTLWRQYLHYNGFAQNREITPENVGLYRRYRVWQRSGLIPALGFEGGKGRLNRWWGYLSHELYVRRFGGANQRREQFAFLPPDCTLSKMDSEKQ